MRTLQRRFVSQNLSKNSENSLKSAEIRTIKSEKRKDKREIRQLVGYSAVFNVATTIRTWFGDFDEKIAVGAFTRAIQEKQNVRTLRNHNPDKLLGSVAGGSLLLREDETGLWMETTLPSTPLADETVILTERGDLYGQSFAFVVRDDKWIAAQDEDQNDLRIITDVDLYDVGPVTYPAYEEASVSARSDSEEHLLGLRSLGRSVKSEFRDDLGQLIHPNSVEARSNSVQVPSNFDIDSLVKRCVEETVEKVTKALSEARSEAEPEEEVVETKPEETKIVPADETEKELPANEAEVEEQPEEKSNNFSLAKLRASMEQELVETQIALDESFIAV